MNTQEILFHEAQDLFISGHPEDSIDLFTKAEKEGCNPVNVHLGRGAAYLNIGQYDRAIEDFEKILEIDSDNERAFYFRGVAEMIEGRYEAAIADFTESIAKNPERGAAFLARGMCLAELYRLEEAGKDLKTALAFSNVEVEKFSNLFGENRTMLDRSRALLEGDRGPWKIVLDETEINKLQKWLE